MQLPAEKREEIRQEIIAKQKSSSPVRKSLVSRKRKCRDSSSPPPATSAPSSSKRYHLDSSSPAPSSNDGRGFNSLTPPPSSSLVGRMYDATPPPPSSTPAPSSSPPLSIIDIIDRSTQADADSKLAKDLQDVFTNEHFERIASEIGMPLTQLYEGDLTGDLTNSAQSSLPMSKAALQYIRAKRPLSRKISSMMGISKARSSLSSRGGEFSVLSYQYVTNISQFRSL